MAISGWQNTVQPASIVILTLNYELNKVIWRFRGDGMDLCRNLWRWEIAIDESQ
jgi:hypothetical protein